jgi:hypothetical protein
MRFYLALGGVVSLLIFALDMQGSRNRNGGGVSVVVFGEGHQDM